MWADVPSAESGSDRYGRMLAYAYTLRDGDEFLLQRELVAEGFARVGGRIANSCAGDLLGPEKAAREAKLGLWADPYYEVLNAESPKDALAQRGRFALVEGKVASVRENGPTIYVNFRPAADWGHYGYDPETKRAQFRGGGSRFEGAGWPTHQGSRLDRGARWRTRLDRG